MTNDDILRRLDEIERRLAALEVNSHPPVDLNAPVIQAMCRVLRRAADDIEWQSAE